MKINLINFPKNQFFAEIFPKKQIVLHHTVSNPFSAKGDADYWASTPARIATYGILDYNGSLTKCFNSNQWAHHLGVKGNNNLKLNQHSIGIELDCWGGLTLKDVKYINAYGKEISEKLEVVKMKWRGYEYFQAYSDVQIAVLGELLQLLMRKHNIPNVGLKDGNFNVRRDALAGKPGIYSHSNYRSDKSDLYPDSRIVNMLRNL
ncbi:MAG: N-acetylmuramoyl-L-alanine amidase [Porphyromonadaceae bacterium]|nr:N-acetylmuramoyl-L-alanine amidase [Porphyromonadaceae bacterium]